MRTRSSGRPPACWRRPIAGVTPAPATAARRQAGFQLEPDAAPDGPVSIIISTGDQQVVVLRNGVEIGRAKAVVQQQTTEAQVMTLTGARQAEWIQVGVTDLADEPAEIISTQRVEQMQLPADFVPTCAR